MPERDWTGAALEPGDRIEGEGLELSCMAPAGASLVSGDLDRAIAALAPGAPVLGLFGDIPPDGPFALRLARDRALLCTERPLDVEGWFGSYGASAADDLHLAVAVRGARAGALRDALFSAGPGSPSAATLMAGVPVIVATDIAGWRLWVPRAEAAAVRMLLEGYVRGL